MKNKQNIGLFGFGTVGGGLFHVLEKGRTADAVIKKICVKNADKPRSLSADQFTFNPSEILDDPDINLVVELIDDADAAYPIVAGALKKGKSVVSGNKRMIASHLDELIKLQEENNAALLYDASACGSIPVIRNLEEYYDNDLLKSIIGILNGSSNYILTRLFNEGISYADALRQAQELGFAESDPTFDVEGYDAMYKLVILNMHGLGAYVSPAQVFSYGISKISVSDIKYAKEKGLKIKLIGHIIKLNHDQFTLFVLPRLVRPDEYIYNVEYEYNGVVIEGECYDKQFMFGKGAGAYPTGSAVLSDITARLHDYRYEYKKSRYFTPPQYTDEVTIEIYLRYQNLVDFALFEFENISEKYSGTETNYVIGTIRLSHLKKIRNILGKLNVFIAFTGKIV